MRENILRIIINQQRMIMFNFLVSTVPADALAPLGARASARSMMTKCKSCIETEPTLHELIQMG